MANRLTKLANIQYTPASPYVPERAAYCTQRTIYEPKIVYHEKTTEDPLGVFTLTKTVGYYSYDVVAKTVRTCYPAVPEQPAVPASISYSAIAGWNGGARSIEPLEGNGCFRFNVSPNPAAVVVGLSGEDASTLPNEPTHAFFVHGGVVEIMESGEVVATAPTAHATEKPLTITRTGELVTYQYDGWSYSSETPVGGATQYLDAAIYASGDFVDNPQQGVAGSGGLVLPAIACIGGDVESWSQGGVRLPRLAVSGQGLVGTVGSGGVTLPRLLLRGADHDAGSGGVVLPRLALAGLGGFPAPQLLYGAMAIPPLVAVGQGLVGTVGSGGVTLPRLLLRGANHDGGQGGVRLPALRTLGLARPVLDYGLASSTLLLASRSRGYATETATAVSTLQLSDALVVSVVVSGVVYDSLLLSSQSIAYQLLTAVAQSTLLLGGSAGPGSARLQYAVNVLTGALSTYRGFDFIGFASAGNGCYAVRPDGLYRLRPGDDDGQPIGVAIDFGTTDFGTIKGKTVEAVFLALTTDGDVIATLRCDGAERRYRVSSRGAVNRVTAAKGVSGRTWGLVLEVADATEFELDAVEHVISVAARRGIR